MDLAFKQRPSAGRTNEKGRGSGPFAYLVVKSYGN